MSEVFRHELTIADPDALPALGERTGMRFGYGSTVPWVSHLDDGSPHGALRAIAGPDMVVLRADVPLRGQGLTTVGEFEVAAGETLPENLDSIDNLARFVVRNVFDEEPPLGATNSANAFGTYDFIGRYYQVGLTARF